MDVVNIALPKGRLLEPSLAVLRSAGVPIPPAEEWGRSAVIDLEDAAIRLFIIRDDDVPTYVIQGAADLGVVGKDVLMEAEGDLFELFDLKEGFCRLVVAVPAHLQEDYKKRGSNHLRVVTKYPRTAAQYFRRVGGAGRDYHRARVNGTGTQGWPGRCGGGFGLHRPHPAGKPAGGSRRDRPLYSPPGGQPRQLPVKE